MEENISEALIMAASVLIFVIALALIFSLISQAKTTTDAVIYSYDDTQYYTDDLEGITFTKSNELNRTVGIDTIMATAYRYAKEHYGVTIMKSDGEIIARFDEETESIAQNWPNYLSRNKEKCEKHLEKIIRIQQAAGISDENLIYKDKDAGLTDNFIKLTELWKEIYQLDKTGASGYVDIKYGTPWLGDESKIAQRLNTDFGNKDATYASGTHNKRNLLNTYKNNQFKEIYLFVSDESGIIKDPDTGDSVIIQSTTSKLEIIYVLQE